MSTVSPVPSSCTSRRARTDDGIPTFTEAGQTVVRVVRRALDGGYRGSRSRPKPRTPGSPCCYRAWQPDRPAGLHPGYYSYQGQAGPEARLSVGYPAGPSADFKYLERGANPGRSKAWSLAERALRAARRCLLRILESVGASVLADRLFVDPCVRARSERMKVSNASPLLR